MLKRAGRGLRASQPARVNREASVSSAIVGFDKVGYDSGGFQMVGLGAIAERRLHCSPDDLSVSRMCR